MARRRAARWVRGFVGPPEAVARAQRLDLSELAAKGKNVSDPIFVSQIELDVPRSGCASQSEREELETVLLAWLSLNSAVGYTQGFNAVAALLLRTFRLGGVPAPARMALAALGSMLRINIGLIPLGAEDRMPLEVGQNVAKEIVLEIVSAAPSLRVVEAGMDVLTVMVLRVFPVLFVDFWSEEALPLVLDYILEDFTVAHLVSCVIAARRCRHVLSASLLLHRKLFVLNAGDVRQSFVIFESCCGIAPARHVAEIVELAQHLERVETLGGAAV